MTTRTCTPSLLQGAQKAGFAYGKDVNDPKLPTSGCFLIHHTIDASSNRSSTFRAFLPKEFALAHQDNLHLCVNTVARKIETETLPDGSLRATGVLVQSDKPGAPSLFARARREVILCSGALRTPQVLVLGYEDRVFGRDAWTDCMSRVAVLAPRSICAKWAFPSCTPSRAPAPTSYVSIPSVLLAQLISSRPQQDHMGTTVDLQCPLEHSLIIFIR